MFEMKQGEKFYWTVKVNIKINYLSFGRKYLG